MGWPYTRSNLVLVIDNGQHQNDSLDHKVKCSMVAINRLGVAGAVLQTPLSQIN